MLLLITLFAFLVVRLETLSVTANCRYSVYNDNQQIFCSNAHSVEELNPKISKLIKKHFIDVNKGIYFQLDRCNFSIFNPSVIDISPHISELPIQFSKIDLIPFGAFKRLKALLDLDFLSSYNLIGIFEKGALLGLDSLKMLKLRLETQEKLPEELLDDLPQLEDLAIGHNPKLSTIHKRDFKKLPNLQWLNLADNGLTEIEPGSFENLKNLQTLLLSGNQITNIKTKVFKGLSNLKVLGLSENKIRNIKRSMSKELTSLDKLSLDKNQIEVIKHSDFSALSNLTRLILSRNKIKDIHCGAFKGLIRLTDLFLDYNELKTLRTNKFDNIKLKCCIFSKNSQLGLSTLEYLTLKGNQIEKLPLGIFRSLSNLTKLNLSKNNLKSLPEGIFNTTNDKTQITHAGLNKLERLMLGKNKIEEVTVETFRGLNYLTELDLSYNHLKSLPEHLLDSMPNLKLLYLDAGFISTLNENHKMFKLIKDVDLAAVERESM